MRSAPEANGAYVFAWGFGFIQFLLEFGMGAALQRQVSLCLGTKRSRWVKRLIACGTMFYLAMAAIQIIVLLAIAYLGLPAKFQGDSRRLIVGLLWIQALSAPFFGLLTVASSVLLAARRYELLPRLDLVIAILRFAILVAGPPRGRRFPRHRRGPDSRPARRHAVAGALGDASGNCAACRTDGRAALARFWRCCFTSGSSFF